MRKIDDFDDSFDGGNELPPIIPAPTPTVPVQRQEERDLNWHTFVIAGIIFLMLLALFTR